MAGGIDQRQFFNAMLVKDAPSFFQTGSFRSGNEPAQRCHDVLHSLIRVFNKPDVTVGDHAFETAFGINHRKSRHSFVTHETDHFSQRHGARHRKRIRNNGVLRTFHPGNLGGLLVDGHVAVDDPEASFASQSNGQLSFRHRVHRR